MTKRPPQITGRRPRLAVHKFSSCDGCQLALLNDGESLLAIAAMADIVHFAEAGIVDEEAAADLTLVEGSVSTPEERERIQGVRARSGYLVAIGACASFGGPQALRNLADGPAWIAGVYPNPEHISALPTARPIADYVSVDLTLTGCPVGSKQVIAALGNLLVGIDPIVENEKVCMECKRNGYVCVLITKGEPCLGPVTATGCGALCPSLGRDCYGCYGPAENPNVASLADRLAARGMSADAISQRFMHQNSGAPPFREAVLHWSERVRHEHDR